MRSTCLPCRDQDLSASGTFATTRLECVVGNCLGVLASYPTTTLFDLLSITISVFGMSFFTAWLRLKTGSIWPAVLWHGNHNLLIQSVLLRMTADTGVTRYFVDDFGIGVLLSSLVMGYVFWSKRSELPYTSMAPNSR